MEDKNIDKILSKYGFASFKIDSGWSSRRSRDGFGRSNPQIGKTVTVKVGTKVVYQFDDMGEDTRQKDDTELKIDGISLWYELVNNHARFLDSTTDWNYGVRFWSGTVTLERKEDSK